jgi:hypothetical protein
VCESDHDHDVFEGIAIELCEERHQSFIVKLQSRVCRLRNQIVVNFTILLEYLHVKP